MNKEKLTTHVMLHLAASVLFVISSVLFIPTDNQNYVEILEV